MSSLGTASVDGTNSVGFQVITSRTVFLAQGEKRLATLDLPASQKATILHNLQTMSPPVYDLWFDTTQHLVRRVSMQTSVTVASGVSGSAGLDFDFTHYGTPVTITTPPASDTTRIHQ